MSRFLTENTNFFTTKNSNFYQLRDYQQSLVQDIFTAWDFGHQSVLAILPTAGGKTICFVEVASTFLAKNQPVLVIAHLEELIRACCKKRKPVAISKLSGIESCSQTRKSGKIQQNPCTSTRENVPKS